MGLVVRIREPEDIGVALTEGYIRKLRMIHTGIMSLAAAFLLMFFYGLFSIDLLEASLSPTSAVNVVGVLAILAATTLIAWGVFILLFYDIGDRFIYSDMPLSKCEEVLEALDTYSELKFLKGRIANMDRKLTTEEGLYITNYHRVILKKKSEDSCKKLYGIRSRG
ncbi:hypothetical protein QTV49_000405 [Vibrio vulnificus]|nr:hypothetical protein [Vibrio vulnificus]